MAPQGGMTVQNNDLGSIGLFGNVHQDEDLTFGGAGTEVEGTILGRITATGKLGPYVAAAGDGTEVPVAVLNVDAVAAGAGDEPIRPIISGQVRRDRLVIKAGGAISPALADQLRNVGIIPLTVDEQGKLDNQ